MARYEELDVGDTESSRLAACRRAALAVAGGGVLAHPTTTVYGLGALPTPGLDASIAALKSRSAREAPLLRLAPDVDTLRRELPGLHWDRRAELLARTFWPGPLTILLADGQRGGVAVRVEDHSLTRQVLASLDGLMSSTSLNRTGDPPASTEEEARSVLEDLPDDEAPIVFLPGGRLAGSPPSTLVSLIGAATEVLRAGAVAAADVHDCLEGVEP